jgi:hypothetical protein
MYKERFSPLAIAAFAMGVLSLVLFPFQRINIAIFIIDILVSIGAIVTGIVAMRRIAIYPLRGRTFAYIGFIMGANGVFWIIINRVFFLIR